MSSQPGTRGIKLFADDAKFYDIDHEQLKLSLRNLLTWLDHHQLQIAPSKCFSLTINRDSNIDLPSFDIHGIPICRKTFLRDLGVLISNDLKWSNHIQHLFRKASAVSYQIIKCFKSRNIWTFKKLFVTYVRPIVEFNTPICSKTKTLLNQFKNLLQKLHVYGVVFILIVMKID